VACGWGTLCSKGLSAEGATSLIHLKEGSRKNLSTLKKNKPSAGGGRGDTSAFMNEKVLNRRLGKN